MKKIKITEQQLKQVINKVINDQQLINENRITDIILQNKDKVLKILNRFNIGKEDLPELEIIYNELNSNPINEGFGENLALKGVIGSALLLVIPLILLTLNLINSETFQDIIMKGQVISWTTTILGLIIMFLRNESPYDE